MRQITVEAKTIDTLFSVLGKRISLIKCDTEGHELECIKGAFAVIKKSMPAWLIEISKDPDEVMSTGYEIFKMLNEEGYEGYWFDGEQLNRRCLGDRSINYLFLTPNHLQALEDNGFFSLFSLRSLNRCLYLFRSVEKETCFRSWPLLFYLVLLLQICKRIFSSTIVMLKVNWYNNC